MGYPCAGSDFWNTYIRYVPQFAKELNANMMDPTNSPHKVENLVATVPSSTAMSWWRAVLLPRLVAAGISLVGSGGNRLGDQFGGRARLVPAAPVDHVDPACADVGFVEHLDFGRPVGG